MNLQKNLKPEELEAMKYSLVSLRKEILER